MVALVFWQRKSSIIRGFGGSLIYCKARGGARVGFLGRGSCFSSFSWFSFIFFVLRGGKGGFFDWGKKTQRRALWLGSRFRSRRWGAPPPLPPRNKHIMTAPKAPAAAPPSPLLFARRHGGDWGWAPRFQGRESLCLSGGEERDGDGEGGCMGGDGERAGGLLTKGGRGGEGTPRPPRRGTGNKTGGRGGENRWRDRDKKQKSVVKGGKRLKKRRVRARPRKGARAPEHESPFVRALL